ncbi:DNA gyrase/topoisomerase IV subunit A [Lachnotalea sp. AF33-28]|uniref:DNA gyrase/topoisomerase IV subunit A n=1 Tax=Lachnotalea sp. AF33-28 TaxID=2292046 RepID=UPI000E4A3FF4|nr:DNA topoisomerase (ATP-hydrolyzing) [Lachnotalea sp. AF33-28]RHP31754.1 DNA topoisomerase 4 subunit A [Lachnotalea sp. AF33-28]
MSEKIVQTEYSEVMQKSYIDYAMSVITARALPDVRDGLKPVQRRILYAMDELGTHHDKPHRKSARIVGDTMGKYHPHGDASIYDAMVVMAQDFKKSLPLVDPHGNFGSIEGDGAAAARYTEARLQEITDAAFLADLDKNVVDMIPNFDGTEKEPSVLPVKIPNLLISGADGIAVGMTTSIPSHNLEEAVDASVACLKNPDITVHELMEYIKGPDWATGGIVINQADLEEIYTSGNGKIKVRGRVEFEKGKRERDRLVITEIPPTMVGSGLTKFFIDLSELIGKKQLPEITDVSNMSDKDGIRIVLEVKRGADIERVKNILYKKTKLEDTFGVNMLAIVDGRPETLSLKAILTKHLDFMVEVNTRKFATLLEKEKDRKEVQEGLIRAIDIIDLIIEIIRGSKSIREAKDCLMGLPNQVNFKSAGSRKEAAQLHFTEVQATAILELRLSKLINLEILALEKEYRQTVAKIARYEKILSDKNAMKRTICEDLEDIKHKFPMERRTEITNQTGAVAVEAKVEEQDLIFTMNRFGYVKLLDTATYERNRETVEAENRTVVPVKNTDKAVFFTDAGYAYQVKAMDIPLAKLRDKGVHIETLLSYKTEEESILYTSSMENLKQSDLVFITRSGLGKIVKGTEFDTNVRAVAGTKLTDGDQVAEIWLNEGRQFVLQTEKGYFLRLTADQLPEMKKNALGNKCITMGKDDMVKAIYVLENGHETINYNGKELDLMSVKPGKRGQTGVKKK